MQNNLSIPLVMLSASPQMAARLNRMAEQDLLTRYPDVPKQQLIQIRDELSAKVEIIKLHLFMIVNLYNDFSFLAQWC